MLFNGIRQSLFFAYCEFLEIQRSIYYYLSISKTATLFLDIYWRYFDGIGSLNTHILNRIKKILGFLK